MMGSPPLSFYLMGWLTILLHLSWTALVLFTGVSYRYLMVTLMVAEVVSIGFWIALYARHHPRL